MPKKYFYILLLIPFIASACATLLIPTASNINLAYAQTRWSDTTLEVLQEGRTLFIETCSGCHSLPKPTDYTEDKWGELIKDMSKEAKLDEVQINKIEKYIFTVLNTQK